MLERILNRKNILILRRFWGAYLSPYRKLLFISVFCMAISATATALLAHFVKDVFDDIFLAKDEVRLFSLTFMILSVFLIKGVTAYGHNFILARFGQKVSASLQLNLFGRLIQADHAMFSRYSSGKLLSLLTYDTQVVLRGMTQTLVSFVRDALTLIFLVGLMFYQDWFLSSIACLMFPLAAICVFFLGKKMRFFSRQTQQSMGLLHTFLGEVFQGIGLVKAYTMEKLAMDKASEKVNDFVRFSLRGARMKSLLHPLMEAIGGTAVVFVIVYGGYQVIAGERTPGALMSFITALLMSYEPLKKLAHLNSYIQDTLSALERIFRLYDVKKVLHNPANPLPFSQEKLSVAFRDVSFSYQKGVPVLKNISFQINQERRVAFVGESGAGKSTLFQLLLRFYDVDNGEILIGGQDIRQFNVKELRQNIAFVSQETILFADTVENNIRYGRPDASDEEVREAARLAYANTFIEKLPQGYQTCVGERGLHLSGGQRQRLAIARAFLKNAPLLLLDEATSSLDAESEYAVAKGLENLMRDRTTFIIAHRLLTVERAEKIYVLSNGHLVQQGVHADLMKQPGVYRQTIVPHFEDGALRQVT